MAEVTGFGLDLSSFIAQADKADRKILNMVQHAQQLQNVLTNALNGATTASFTSIMDRLTSQVDNINNKKVSPNFNTQEAEKLYGIMNNVAQVMQILGQNKVPLFDTQNVYATNQGLFTAQDNLSKINNEITKLNEEWKKQGASTFTPVKFAIPKYEPLTNDKGKAYGKNTKIQQQHRAEYDEKIKLLKEWETAYNKHQEQIFNQEKKNSQLAIELELRELIEKKAIASEELKWAKMTQDEKTQYVLKKMTEELNIEEKKINEVRKNYRSYLNEMNSLSSKIDKNERKNDDGALTQQIETQKARFQQLDVFRRELETNYGVFLVDIAEKANARAADITAARLRKEADAKKAAEDAQWQKYLSSPEGALDLATNAKTINQMKEAQKYLQEARGNVDTSDLETIKKLNDEYTRLRMTIESLTTAEKNEHSLQPTLRNEYARLLVELDKVTDAKNRASKTNAFQLGDAKAQQDYAALLAREQDIREKMSQIEKAALPNTQEKAKLEKEIADWTAERVRLGKLAGSKDIAEARKGGGSQTAKDYLFAEEQVKALQAKLANTEKNESAIDEIVRRHEATRAANSIAETEKTERVEFEAERKRLLEIQELRRQTATRSTARANQIVDQSENVKNIAQEEQAVKRLEDARRRLNKNDADYEATLKRINDAIAQHTHNIKMATDASYREAQAKKQAQQQNTTYKGAMNYSDSVKSINDRIKAIEYLKQARANLDRTSMSKSEYEKQIKALTLEIQKQQKEVDRLTGKSSNLKKGMGKLGNVVQQLKSQLTALFGIAAIKGYIQKLVDVRREFERQQTALEGILQSKDEADKLWSQTTQLALKSPFSVRELITYTKQLSAYRIETDKLHDTTKRLADVSAGLGVDMSRLILAYGQVRAAEYLRGTELRQFTEAGIPMLEELADYFEEVEGRAYTTAEVFGMISNRMVEFEDVEAVIQRMTDEGGIFFEMQEKQSKTLYGEMSNLKDAYELMLNDIGKSQQSVITSFFRNMRYLINSWYDLIPLITSVGFGLTAGVFGSGIIKAIKGFANLRRQIKLTGASMLTLSKIPTTGWVAIIGLVASLASYLIQVATRTDEVTAAMNALNNEINNEMSDSVLEYKKLAREITDVTKSYSEQEQAMSRLKRKFQDILPDQYTEIEYITQMADGYREATHALESHYNEKLRRQKEDKLNSVYDSKLTQDIDQLTKGIMEGTIAKYNKDGSFLKLLSSKGAFGEYFNLTETHVTQVINSVIERIKEGEVEVENLRSEIIKTLEKFYGIKFDGLFAFGSKTVFGPNVQETLDTITRTLLEYKDQLSKVGGLRFETKQLEDEDKARREANKRLEEEKEIINELSAAYSKYYKAKEKQTEKGTTPELEKAIEGFKGDIKTNYEKLKLDFPVDDFFNITANQHAVTNEIEKITKQIYNRFQKQIEEESKTNPLLDNFSEDLANAIEDLDSNKDIKETTEQLFKALSEQFSIPMSMFDKFEAKSDSTFESVRKKMEDELELIKKSLEKYYNALDTMPKMKTLEWQEDWVKRTTGLTPEKVKVLETFVEVLTIGAQALGGAIKKTTTGNNKSQKDYYSDVLKILQDTHKEYKDLANTLSHVDAKQLALDKHTRAFAEAVKNIPSLAKFKLEDFAFDKEDGAIEMLEKLKSLIPTTAKNYKSLMVDIEQAIGDIRGEAIIEAKVKADEDLANEIEEMFDGYELSLELDKLGLPKNFMSDLFHIGIFNLDQIRDKIEGEIDKIESGKGEKDNLKKLQDFLKKVDDMEEKQMQERLKKYSKYLLKSQSEAVKIKLEELRQLEEIESLSDVSNAQKSVMKQGVRDETQKKLDKATWDTFKDGDMYIRLFEDLESQSTRSLNRMREELKKYRNSLKELDPTALKEISERIESLDEQIAKRNPFKGLSEGYKNFREVIKKYGSRSKLENSLAINKDKEQTLIKRVDDQQIKVATERKALNDALLKDNVLEISARKQSLATEEETLDVMLKQLDAQKEITQEQAKDLKKQQEAKKEFEDSLSGLGNDIAEYTSALPEIMNDLEAMGVSVDESLKDAAESAAEIGEGVNSIMQGFASNNPLAVIQGITKTGAAISRIFDKSEERRIQRRIEKIEDLSRAYETLQKRIENAYSIGEFRSSYDESYQNIDEQIQAYEDMIAAEEDKKKSDKERIKEWKQAQEDLEQQKKELQDQQLQELGGFGESGVKDAAQQFVDAWMDAFQETGDGLSGLEDKWDEYIKNVIRKQMALKVSDHFIKNITDEVDKALKDDSNLSAEELAKINQMADEALPALSEALQKIANEYGGSALSPSVGELSGLTQGIQGITEQTADQLAGLVNSIRLLVADNYKELVNIANALGTSTQVENPMVGQLKIIASHTNNINSLLESVVTSSTSGRGIRVITQV